MKGGAMKALLVLAVVCAVLVALWLRPPREVKAVPRWMLGVR